jgi:hypothetical protein
MKPGSFLKDSGSECLERAEHLECDVRVSNAVARKKAGTLGSGLVLGTLCNPCPRAGHLRVE